MSALRIVKHIGIGLLVLLHLRHFWGIVFHADHRMVHVGGVVRFLILAWILQAILGRSGRSSDSGSAAAINTRSS
jgi:hypothetical protein